MNKETTGEVISVSKQWWFKVNTKSFRKGPFDGATFPHIIKVKYTVNEKEYTKRKWIHAGNSVPFIGSFLKVSYCESKPSKAKVIL
jgi:hypothetical protein